MERAQLSQRYYGTGPVEGNGPQKCTMERAQLGGTGFDEGSRM